MRGIGRVLVADGDLRLRAQLGVTLAAAGHVVVDAGSVRDAVGMLRSRHPDVVVLDVSEGYHGIALLRTLRDEVPGPHPAIVALAPPDDTALAAPGARRALRSARGDFPPGRVAIPGVPVVCC